MTGADVFAILTEGAYAAGVVSLSVNVDHSRASITIRAGGSADALARMERYARELLPITWLIEVVPA